MESFVEGFRPKACVYPSMDAQLTMIRDEFGE